MTLPRSWYTLEEAESKFGVERATILKWVEEGIVRSEDVNGRPVRVDVDDIELKVEELAYRA